MKVRIKMKRNKSLGRFQLKDIDEIIFIPTEPKGALGLYKLSEKLELLEAISVITLFIYIVMMLFFGFRLRSDLMSYTVLVIMLVATLIILSIVNWSSTENTRVDTLCDHIINQIDDGYFITGFTIEECNKLRELTLQCKTEYLENRNIGIDENDTNPRQVKEYKDNLIKSLYKKNALTEELRKEILSKTSCKELNELTSRIEI